MKTIIQLIVYSLLIVTSFQNVYSQYNPYSESPIVLSTGTVTAVSNGDWGTTSTWDCNCLPANTVNIVIPSGINVTIPTLNTIFHNNLTEIVNVVINGTLTLTNGNLTVNGNDIITIASGGQITATSLGGSITSGLTTIPLASNATINGPGTITNGTLPIKLLFFNATAEEGIVQLSWASASEKNFHYFDITRSVDGLTFTSIGKVYGAGNSSSRRNYSFVDAEPPAETVYYRLRAVDLDGISEAFSIIVVQITSFIPQVSTYPNPVSGGSLNLKFNFTPKGNVHVTVYNSYGHLVTQQLLSDQKDLSTIELPAGIGSGSYIIAVKSNELESKIPVHVKK